jgi:transcriptional regulator with GAF, ATPase, and Fis domain
MKAETKEKIDEVKRLRACVNDLISVLALPALWSGGDKLKIVSALLDVLLAMLRLDFVYAELRDTTGGDPIEAVRHAQSKNPSVGPCEIASVLHGWLKKERRNLSPLMKDKTGDVSMVPMRLGLQNEIGWIVVGSRRADFPNETEKLLLNVAVNQAAIGLQDARLLQEQRRLAKELDLKVVERTKELQELKDQLQRENVVLREQVDEASMFEEIVGNAHALQAVLARVSKVAPTDSTVLITGETGTGKELIARAIHKRSARAGRAFVKVNCAAIPTALIASELFGHERGAFTGALQRRLGRFELAQGGTLFLDEVGELPAETQIALLRVLQEREFERVGGSQSIKADVRLITATNRDLKSTVSQGSFRGDLFYRLNVFPIEMPSLRMRTDDIPLLTEYFIQRYADKLGKKIRSIDKRTLQRFQTYGWPGNIRELQNVIERSLILCDTEMFSVDESWLARDSPDREIRAEALPQKLVADEKALIEAALTQARGRVSGPAGAAIRLGIPASTLESKIRTLKLNKHAFKAT